MPLDGTVGVCLALLALWILISGLDDLMINVVFLLGRRRPARSPQEADRTVAPRRRMAVFVPLWNEHEVIGRMLEHNLAAIRYPNYDIFAGVYPNDSATAEAVREACARHDNVHMVVCPRAGPTSKADCLNAIYRGMVEFERERGTRFEILITHDAEDLVHPRELELIDRFAAEYDMVQIPVLPLATPLGEWVHGLYCDEFAEYQTKDIPVRQWLGGFLPSNGVGTGFSRAALEELAAQRGGAIFEPACLTEDYENGFAIHASGRPQAFVPLRPEAGGFTATREYFPRSFRGAIKQRARWVTGIGLQGWARHGWRVPVRQMYWFWRDRKGLVGNLLAPAANLLFGYGVWRLMKGLPLLGSAAPAWLAPAGILTLALSVQQIAVRTFCVAQIYGPLFALGVPVRAMLGNWLNAAATVQALGQYAAARWRGSSLAWGKTAHQYPDGCSLRPYVPKLGEILVDLRHITSTDLERALKSLPRDRRLGEHLLHLQILDEQQLYQGLSSQFGIPLAGTRHPQPSAEARRVLPAAVASRWRAVPVRVAGGTLHVGVTDAPSPELCSDLERFCPLPVRYWLYPPSSLPPIEPGGAVAFGD